MCNCIDKIKKIFLERMKNEHGFTEVIDEPFLVHHSWYPEVKPYFPVKGKFMQGKKQRVFSISIYPTFCPFCGNEYE